MAPHPRTRTARIARSAAGGLLIACAVLAAGLLWMTWMPRRTFAGPLPRQDAQEAAVEARLREHVGRLSGPLAPRNLAHPERLDGAARYIKDVLKEEGFEVGEDRFEVRGHPVANLEAKLPGLSSTAVIVGAHYDSVETPGANDNATGVAAVMEIARWLREHSPTPGVRFLFFATEEPPFFDTAEMGSRRYARRAAAQADPIALMVNIDMIGCYREASAYAFPVSWVLGTRGDFVAFLGNVGSQADVRRLIGEFRATTAFPSRGLAVPEYYPGLAGSDHGSFWREGFRAVYVTDTGPLRGCPHHSAADDLGGIDFPKMSRVVVGLGRTLAAEVGARP